MTVEICLIALTLAIIVLIYFGVKVLVSFNQCILLMSETIDKTKMTIDETNAILKNTNEMTKDAGAIAHMVKDNVQSVDNVLSVVKKAGSVIDVMKKKKN